MAAPLSPSVVKPRTFNVRFLCHDARALISQPDCTARPMPRHQLWKSLEINGLWVRIWGRPKFLRKGQSRLLQQRNSARLRFVCLAAHDASPDDLGQEPAAGGGRIWSSGGSKQPVHAKSTPGCHNPAPEGVEATQTDLYLGAVHHDNQTLHPCLIPSRI